MRDESKFLSRLFSSPKSDVISENISCIDSSKEAEKRDESVDSDENKQALTAELRNVNGASNDADIERRDPLSSIKKLLCRSMKNLEQDPDTNIGLRLALPDKVDIMRGLQAPTAIYDHGMPDSPISKSKKLIIVPDYNIPSPLASFRRISLGTPTHLQFNPDKEVDEINEKREEIVIRTSEQEPSVHQLVIPSATDLLIHARICSLLEGYDHLLESRAKARKSWFDFSTLVGMDR